MVDIRYVIKGYNELFGSYFTCYHWILALEVDVEYLLISLYIQSIGVFSTNTKSISWPTKMKSVSSNNDNQDPNRIVTEVRHVST